LGVACSGQELGPQTVGESELIATRKRGGGRSCSVTNWLGTDLKRT